MATLSGAITNMPVNNCSSFNFTDFVKLHKVQLKDSAVPDKYWPALFEKLKDEVCLRISNVTRAYIIAQFGMVVVMTLLELAGLLICHSSIRICLLLIVIDSAF